MLRLIPVPGATLPTCWVFLAKASGSDIKPKHPLFYFVFISPLFLVKNRYVYMKRSSNGCKWLIIFFPFTCGYILYSMLSAHAENIFGINTNINIFFKHNHFLSSLLLPIKLVSLRIFIYFDFETAIFNSTVTQTEH